MDRRGGKSVPVVDGGWHFPFVLSSHRLWLSSSLSWLRVGILSQLPSSPLFLPISSNPYQHNSRSESLKERKLTRCSPNNLRSIEDRRTGRNRSGTVFCRGRSRASSFAASAHAKGYEVCWFLHLQYGCWSQCIGGGEVGVDLENEMAEEKN